MHYLVGEGEGRERALQIAGNAQLSNFMMIQAISRISDMVRGDGLFTEGLAAAISQTSTDAGEGLKAFPEKRSPKFR